MRVWALLFVLICSMDVKAHCYSDVFDSWAIDENYYSPGREAFYSSHNLVEPSVYAYSDAIFQKIGELVSNAEKRVYLQTWTFDSKAKPALYLAEAIRFLHARRVRQRKSGTVHIWLMLNIIALQNEEAERRAVSEYLEKQGLLLPGIKIHVGFFKANLLGANHVKTVSVDNKVAFVSGANFSSKNNGRGFFDLGFVVRGEVLSHIDYDFVQTWKSKVDREHYPQVWKASKSTYSGMGCNPILLTRSWAFPNFTSEVSENSMTHAFIQSVEHATETIDIITPNLNVTEFMTALAQAAYRGVRVRIILSKRFTEMGQDLPTRGGNNFKSVSRLHNALQPYLGRRVCDQLQIRWYSADGISAIEGTKVPSSHAKFMIVDDKITYFGSANMDNQSWVNSRELALFVDNRDLATRWRRGIFDKVFNRSIEVDQCSN